MNISRKKFIILFIIFGFVFMFITTSLLGTTGVRGMPKAPDSALRTGSNSQVTWKRNVSTIILPIKAVLIGPLLVSYDNFLREDPPPPFVAGYYILYWSVLALFIHYLIGKFKRF
jgi:hypothetical protein